MPDAALKQRIDPSGIPGTTAKETAFQLKSAFLYKERMTTKEEDIPQVK